MFVVNGPVSISTTRGTCTGTRISRVVPFDRFIGRVTSRGNMFAHKAMGNMVTSVYRYLMRVLLRNGGMRLTRLNGF